VNLVLTYHRIVPSQHDVSGFFDNTADEFSRQLHVAVEIWKNIKRKEFLFEGQDSMSPRAPHLVVTFDDGTEDHHRLAAPLLERQALRGIFYVSTALLDTPGYLTRYQCQDLISRGHAVESHGHRHIPFHALSKDSIIEELAHSKRELASLGCGKLDSFAAVGGYLDPALEEALRATAFRSLRTLRWGYNARSGFRWESFNVNRSTGGTRFRILAEPNLKSVKKLIYALKEITKNTLFRKVYYSLRDRIRG